MKKSIIFFIFFITYFCVASITPVSCTATNLTNSINVKDFGAIGDGISDDTDAIQSAFNALNNSRDTLIFPEGNYKITSRILVTYKDNLNIIGNNTSLIRENKNTTSEGIIYFKYCSNININSIVFSGYTTNSNNIVNGDFGLVFFGSNNIDITNCSFKNFGDSAIQMGIQSFDDPTNSIHNSNINVSKNTFDNIYQTSTTPIGADNYYFCNNTITNLKGAIKFAQRYPNGKNLIIKNNTIIGKSNTTTGIEICNYSNVEITDNTIQRCGIGINIYSNTKAPQGFNWENITIGKNNMIDISNTIIRFFNSSYIDELSFIVNNININDNTIDNSNYTTTNYFTYFGGNQFKNINISNNIITGKLKTFFNYDAFTLDESKASEIVIEENTILKVDNFVKFESKSKKTSNIVINKNTVDILSGFFYSTINPSENITISNNHVTASNTILYFDALCKNILVSNNNFYTSANVALNIRTTDCVVQNNKIHSSNVAIRHQSNSTGNTYMHDNDLVGTISSNGQTIINF